MGKIGARQSSSLKAICTAPSINKTPVGSATPPIPYPTTQDLSNSASVATSVLFNDNPAYTLSETEQPACKGDDPGTANGVKSGTVNGSVKPTGAASDFKAEKHYVVRQGDANVMNGGNNPGIYVTTQIPHAPGGPAAAASPAVNNPPVEPETPEEDSFLSKQGNAAVPALGALAGTGKLLVVAALAKASGAVLAPCLGFTPGKKN